MNLTFLLWGNILVWAGIGGYVLFLARKQSSISKRLEQMEISRDEHFFNR
ncbi:MAG: CcmD family protein [Desulfovibrionales bacterium]